MNSSLLIRTKQICSKYHIKPARSRGQNFLIASDVYARIVEAVDLEKIDSVLEVGPGLGFLTEMLASRAKQVIAVELDDKLASILKKRLSVAEVNNVKVVNENVLDLEIGNWILDIGNYKVVANLPYNITSVFLRKFLTRNNKPTEMVLMLQKEVAERIVAAPPRMSLLALSVQFYSDPEIMFPVLKSNFWPQPKVDSAVIKIKTKKKLLPVDEKKFWQIIKHGFSSKRKKLANNLAAGYRIDKKEAMEIIEKAGFSANIRAQELSLEDWQLLLNSFLSCHSGAPTKSENPESRVSRHQV